MGDGGGAPILDWVLKNLGLFLSPSLTDCPFNQLLMNASYSARLQLWRGLNGIDNGAEWGDPKLYLWDWLRLSFVRLNVCISKYQQQVFCMKIISPEDQKSAKMPPKKSKKPITGDDDIQVKYWVFLGPQKGLQMQNLQDLFFPRGWWRGSLACTVGSRRRPWSGRDCKHL